MDRTPKNKLGKGLGSLLGDGAKSVISTTNSLTIKTENNSFIRIDSIELNPDQPRTFFKEEALEELAQSIKTYGLIQPITVRPISNGKYQLISGERRLRASKLAGLEKIPAYVRDVDDLLSVQMALVENIQREDLNAIEIACSYQRLIDECKLSQEELSKNVGKKQSTISNYLRLLKLTDKVQIAVRDKQISMGHARAIVTIEDSEKQNAILEKIIKGGLSVRQTEALMQKFTEENSTRKKMKVSLSADITDFKTHLSKKLNAKVSVSKDHQGKGKISIAFASEEELAKIIKLLN